MWVSNGLCRPVLSVSFYCDEGGSRNVCVRWAIKGVG